MFTANQDHGSRIKSGGQNSVCGKVETKKNDTEEKRGMGEWKRKAAKNPMEKKRKHENLKK